jgi:phosphoserine phosphatase RsbU/P
MSQTNLFKKVPIFSDLPQGELETLSTTLEIVELENGQVLFCENEPGDSLYIVIEGQLEIIMGMDTSDERRLTLLGAGEFVGEMALLIPGRARTASVRALKAARLWKMTDKDFEALLYRQPKLAYTMVATLTRRLDSTTMSSFHDLQTKNHQLQQAYDELKAAQAQLVEKERIERELQLAAEIQVSILPQELLRIPGYDFGALMHPARMVGGDFYDVFSVGGDRIGIVIGDVTDKGVPAAIFMARTHALIMSEATHGGTPGEILRRVNKHLIQLAQSDQFVTVILGLLDRAAGKFDFARAGHEHPLLIHERGIIEMKSQRVGQPVGILEEILLDEHSIVMPPGSTLLLFTDGVTDARNPRGKVFSYKRLRNALVKYSGKGGQETCDSILETIRKFQSTARQEDDITMVALHRDLTV